MMNVEIVEVEEGRKDVLMRLLQLYEYEFSVFNETDVNEEGLFEYENFDRYWEKENWHPFLFRYKGNILGFALVRTDLPSKLFDGEKVNDIAEFFIMKRYRRRGLGKRAAFKIFDEFPGRWEIWQLEKNIASKKFWRSILGEYTDGEWHERWGEKGPIQYFDNSE